MISLLASPVSPGSREWAEVADEGRGDGSSQMPPTYAPYPPPMPVAPSSNAQAGPSQSRRPPPTNTAAPGLALPPGMQMPGPSTGRLVLPPPIPPHYAQPPRVALPPGTNPTSLVPGQGQNIEGHLGTTMVPLDQLQQMAYNTTRDPSDDRIVRRFLQPQQPPNPQNPNHPPGPPNQP